MDAKRGVVAKIVGLTGSIASGKSHVLELFAAEGVPTQSSDKIAHELINGAAFDAIASAFPESVVDNKIDRQLLGQVVFADAAKKQHLEKILHPMIRLRNIDFARNADAGFVVIEIPLLFESDAQSYCDYTIALNVSRETLQKRALKRDKMTADKFEQILNSQLPTEEKLRRADFVIDNEDEHDTVSRVKEIIGKINERNCT